MNKGNVFGGEITPEQRARISQKFRQAKALLSRKRPSDNSSFLSPPTKLKDGNRINTYRIPLNEIDVNTPPQFPAKCSRLTYSNSITPCPGKPSMNNHNDDCSRKILQSESPSSNGSTITSITTPLNHKEFVENLNDASSLPAADLDGDFDEAVLKEIDALIEQKSASKTQQKTPLGHDNGSSAVNINYPESLTIEKPLGDEGVLDLGKRIDTSAEQNIPPGNDNIASADTISYVKSLTINKPLANEGALDLGKRTEASVQGSEVAPALNDDRLPQAYSKYLQSLNEQQREAACSDISVPLMIVAGPGSGKTSTMVGRILMLIHEGISPSNILAMTFTTAAASEMRERIAKVAGKEPAKELTISTFHSFCLQLCRSHADKLGRTSEFLIYGHGQQRRAIIEAVRLIENKTNNGENPDVSKLDQKSSGMERAQYFKDKSKKWQKIVTQAKASGRTPEDCCKIGDDKGATILGNYDDILRSCNALDYHDLISCAVKLLTDFQEVYDECQGLWKAIVIDEFQDTSAMQYNFLHLLASHNHITVVGDEDQSIFSFNGADISGFDSFRKDFPNHKEIRLSQNYRSTRSIVEAASSLINNNVNRCQLKKVVTDNCLGFKITVKECHNEDAQCDFIVDKILETISDNSHGKCSFGSIAILYRRQVSGKAFQRAFRCRKIPFNVHGVAFYRKKVIKAIMAMLRTTLPGCDDGPLRQSFKALLPCEKEEKKRVIDYIDKISTIRKCSFVSAAYDIFAAKISGTFKRSQLSQGYKVLFTLDMIAKLVRREPSISTVITSVANMLPQKYLLEQRAVVDADGGKLLNEDNDLRSVLQYLLDDVSDFLSSHFSLSKLERDSMAEGKGCANILKAFIDYISTRESESFRSRRRDNGESVTLTTIHQSKGLEWDTVFIVKANETEIPLLHEFNGFVRENGTSLEEERRLLYVAMTRARKKLYILYVLMDSNWQLLQPSRFLKEIPDHLREVQGDSSRMESHNLPSNPSKVSAVSDRAPTDEQLADVSHAHNIQAGGILSDDSVELSETCNGSFLKRFSLEDRSVVSHVFHQWAKKKAFENPKRLLDKIGFVIDERLRSKTTKNKDALRALKSCLKCDEAFHYAENILRWEKLPADTRAHLMREKQEYFQKLRIENAMGSSVATSKQITYLQSLGCTVVPTSRLHASHLIEQYKSL